jgi:hypothetical protein
VRRPQNQDLAFPTAGKDMGRWWRPCGSEESMGGCALYIAMPSAARFTLPVRACCLAVLPLSFRLGLLGLRFCYPSLFSLPDPSSRWSPKRGHTIGTSMPINCTVVLILQYRYISLVAASCMVLYGYDASVYNAVQGSKNWLAYFHHPVCLRESSFRPSIH